LRKRGESRLVAIYTRGADWTAGWSIMTRRRCS